MKTILYLFILILLINLVAGLDTVGITAQVKTYSEHPDTEIYVGSFVFYNISIINLDDHKIKSGFNISIADSEGNVVHHRNWNNLYLLPNDTKNFLPELSNGEYQLIIPANPGTYFLEIISTEKIKFLDNRTIKTVKGTTSTSRNFYRYEHNKMVFPFHVASLYEKNIRKINEEQFEKNKKLNEQVLDYTKKVYDLTKKLNKATWIILISTIVMLIVSVLQLSKRQ